MRTPTSLQELHCQQPAAARLMHACKDSTLCRDGCDESGHDCTGAWEELTPEASFTASRACKDPMMPGTTPSTPASEHREQLAACGASGNMHL